MASKTNAWAAVDADGCELHMYYHFKCLGDKMPLPYLAEAYIYEALLEAKKQGEVLDLKAFKRGFLEAAREVAQISIVDPAPLVECSGYLDSGWGSPPIRYSR